MDPKKGAVIVKSFKMKDTKEATTDAWVSLAARATTEKEIDPIPALIKRREAILGTMSIIYKDRLLQLVCPPAHKEVNSRVKTHRDLWLDEMQVHHFHNNNIYSSNNSKSNNNNSNNNNN